MAIDLGVLYREARLRVTDLVADADGSLPVPATPLWNLHDVVAHLAGSPEDVRNGNLEGVTTDPWTAAQVERGRNKSVAELVAQWSQDAPLVEGVLSAGAAGNAELALMDLITHEADLRNALGQPIDLPDEFLAWAANRLRRGFDRDVQNAGLPPVTVIATELEVFRGRLGRRTEDEVRAYQWSLDPEPYLDTWFIFGRAETSLGEFTTTVA